MLHEFLIARSVELIDRCRIKAAQRCGVEGMGSDFDYGVPVFLEQLIATLQAEHALGRANVSESGHANTSSLRSPYIGPSARLHGRELLEQGFAVDEVVRNYGDLCQAITELAAETKEPIGAEEFRTLNGCLDDAIATAVIEFSQLQRLAVWEKSVEVSNARVGFLAHELRNLIHTSMLAVSAMKAGTVGLNGATGAVLDRSLSGLAQLVQRSLAEVRVTAQSPARREVIVLADFIAETKVSASLEATWRECTLHVAEVDGALCVEADPDMLHSALSNVLQNAFKYTCHGSQVSLSVYAAADRIQIEVADRCGGLPTGAAENMFPPFVQVGGDKSGLGLGLSIARRSVEENDGVLSVRDSPGVGCVFTIDLPRHIAL